MATDLTVSDASRILRCLSKAVDPDTLQSLTQCDILRDERIMSALLMGAHALTEEGKRFAKGVKREDDRPVAGQPRRLCCGHEAKGIGLDCGQRCPGHTGFPCKEDHR